MGSLLFRALVLATLLIVGALFATKQGTSGIPADINSPRAEQRANNVEPEKTVLGVGAEGWTAIFTGALFVSTTALFAVTVGLFQAAVQGSKDAERLFKVDQRPWLKVEANVIGSPIYNVSECSITLRLHISCENIGKSPAVDASNGTSQFHIGYDGFQEDFDGISRFVAGQSASKGKTIFPRDDVRFDCEISLSKEAIQRSRAITEGLPMHFFTVGYAYRSNLSEDLFETILMYQFGIPHWQTPLPLPDDANWGKGVEFRLWKESVT